MIEELLVFLLTFIFFFLIYELFLVRKSKKDKKAKKPIEINYLVSKYKLDFGKVKYKRLLNIICFVSSFDISLVVTVISIIDNFFLQLLVGFALIMLLILVSYDIVGRIYKQKGYCKDE